MDLIDRIFDLFEIFVVSFACIVPVAFLIGMIIAIPLTSLPDRRHLASPERRQRSRKLFSKWPELLVSLFIGGFAAFPIARLVNGSLLIFWNYLAVTVALVFFALINPVMSGETLAGDSGEETQRNVYAFWGGIAIGGLAGALSMWYWSQ